MKKHYLRSTGEISLLKKQPRGSLPIISRRLSHYVMDNNDYFLRALSKVGEGRSKLREMLEDVRKVVFNQEELINWFCKIKEDTIGETDLIFIEFDATLGPKNRTLISSGADF